MRLVGVLALVVLVGCVPPVECGAGQVCPDGGQPCTGGGCDGGQPKCPGKPVQGAPPNLLDNPEFECGSPPEGWDAKGGGQLDSDSFGRNGTRAARLSAPTGGAAASLWHTAPAVTAPGTRTFCARAWMRGTAANGRLTIRKVVKGSPVVNDETFSSPLGADWVLVPPAGYGPMKVTGAGEDYFLLRIWIPDAQPGNTLVADDAELWESADGGCRER
ncbi:MAG: hypothetical protein HYZ28_04965 [Myxococcales bacterium]|nr:hypothetical protein [Myxococcales bacterium]